MEKLAEKIDSLNNFIGNKFSWLCLVIVCLMFFNVVQRYIFSNNAIWQQELIQYLHAIMFLSVSGYTLLNEKHVRVDVFYERMNRKKRNIVDVLGTLILLIPANFAIIYFSFYFIDDSWGIYESSRENDGMSGVFILKTFIAFYAVLLIMQGISTIIKIFANSNILKISESFSNNNQ